MARDPSLDEVLAAYANVSYVRQDRRAVCKSCHTVMNDSEPAAPRGQFYHKTTFKDGKTNRCKNSGKSFVGGDPEIEPFMRKSVRRRARRLRVR